MKAEKKLNSPSFSKEKKARRDKDDGSEISG
jgi:hypothetical protein